MSIEVIVSVNKDTIVLGETVKLTYSCTGAQDTTIMADSLANPIDLGSGDQIGTITFLPIVSGTFNITVTGLGNAGMGSESTSALSRTVSITVN